MSNWAPSPAGPARHLPGERGGHSFLKLSREVAGGYVAVGFHF
jgi:hypothetical protein